VELNKLVAVAIVVSIGLVGMARADAEADAAGRRVPNPIVTRAAGGHGAAAGGMRYDVTQFGYQEREYFFAGTAKAYGPVSMPPAPYRSRMIVWAPTDPSHFNGTTVVEWAEVSDFGQFELTVELNYESPMLEQRGYAFALVSAEQRGVCDHTPTGCTPTSLQGADPGRYGSLDHPGDAYSFDIFSQAMQAIKHPVGTAPLGTLKTRILIAEGFQRSVDKYFPTGAPPSSSPSSSPFGIYGPLNDYLANGADRDARLADAFLIDAAAPAVEPHYRVPTLHHLDESAIRRIPTPDRRNHVTWEITGAPHVDPWAGGYIDIPSTDGPKPKLTRREELARRDKYDNFGQEAFSPGAVSAPAPSTGSTFPRRFTLDAAIVDLRTWVAKGVRAPAAPRIERTAAVPDSPMKKLDRDRDGNAIGGLRSPIIQVPFATYNGEAFVASGTTIALSPERIAQLYPTHKGYVRRLLATTDEAVAKRFLVCEDAETIMRKASASTVGGPDPYTEAPGCARRSR
jgi:alpha/beta hydrolase family protein